MFTIRIENDSTLLYEHNRVKIIFKKQKRYDNMIDLTREIYNKYITNDILLKFVNKNKHLTQYKVNCRLSSSKDKILCISDKIKLKIRFIVSFPFIHNGIIQRETERYAYVQDELNNISKLYKIKIDNNEITLFIIN